MGARIKGASLIEALAWLEHTQGRPRVAAALERLEPEVRALIDLERPSFGILASSWYDSAAAGFVLDALTHGVPLDQRDRMARDLAKAVMDGTLRGVYGMLFSAMATPERYARYAPRLWAKYFDDGDVQLAVTAPRTMTGTIKSWEGHHPLLCSVIRFARCAALEAMGCKDVVSEHRCKTNDGGTECFFVVRWR
jgi:hypothetical protein